VNFGSLTKPGLQESEADVGIERIISFRRCVLLRNYRLKLIAGSAVSSFESCVFACFGGDGFRKNKQADKGATSD
jgi:hypothetical protein